MLDDVHKIVLETLQINKQVIIFLPSRASAEKTAEDLAKLTTFNLPELEQIALHALSTPTKQCRRLSNCVRKGVAFHHSGLVAAQREMIEDGFKTGTIKVICCTPTLAAGLSLPAFRVIIKSLKRFSGSWGMDWIPVLEYLQMAGRAGRPEYENWGEAITIAKDEKEKEEIYERYVCGVPEEIYSKLAVEPVLRTYLLSLISSGIIRDEKSMKDFFGKTFWAYQFQDMKKLEEIMDRMLSLLEGWKFVTVSGENGNTDFVTASSIGKKTGRSMKATLLGKRVSELYLDPLTAYHLLECLEEYDESKNTFSLLQMAAHTLEMRPQLTIKVKDREFVQEELNKRFDQLLEDEPSAFDDEYGEFMNSIKTTLFLGDWIEEKDEDFLMEKYDIRPGEIRAKLEKTDWLLYAAQEIAKITQHRIAIRELEKLRLRVQDGVREELLVLLKLKGIGRIRARRLYGNGIKDLGDIKKVDLATLGQILGKAIAEDVKKQVGEEVKEVPAGKRKGQLGLGKF